MRLDCHFYLLRKIEMHGSRNERYTWFNVSNYNVPLYSKSTCHQSFLYQAIYKWNSKPLYIRKCDPLEVFKELYKKYLLTCQ